MLFYALRDPCWLSVSLFISIFYHLLALVEVASATRKKTLKSKWGFVCMLRQMYKVTSQLDIRGCFNSLIYISAATADIT